MAGPDGLRGLLHLSDPTIPWGSRSQQPPQRLGTEASLPVALLTTNPCLLVPSAGLSFYTRVLESCEDEARFDEVRGDVPAPWSISRAWLALP